MNLSCMNFRSRGSVTDVLHHHTTMITVCCTSPMGIWERFGPGTTHVGFSVTVLCSPLPLWRDTETEMSHETRAMLDERTLLKHALGRWQLAVGLDRKEGGDCCSSRPGCSETQNGLYSKGTPGEQVKTFIVRSSVSSVLLSYQLSFST